MSERGAQMNNITDARYESFRKNLEAVNGTCVRAARKKIGEAVAGIFQEAGVKDACLPETPLFQETGVKEALEAAGIQVYTDHIRLHAETARGGISEAQYGIAELGTLVQCRDSADERIAATMSEVYVGVVPGSEIVETYDDMFDLLSGLDPIPNFVGFITGPSRTADIECVSTVGVHGPIQLFAVVVDDA